METVNIRECKYLPIVCVSEKLEHDGHRPLGTIKKRSKCRLCTFKFYWVCQTGSCSYSRVVVEL